LQLATLKLCVFEKPTLKVLYFTSYTSETACMKAAETFTNATCDTLTKIILYECEIMSSVHAWR